MNWNAPSGDDTPSLGVSRWRRLLRALPIVAAYALVVVAATVAADWLIGLLGMELRPTTEPFIHRLIMASLLAYVLLMALPFVPGVEIGLALIMLLGPEIVPVVYVATVSALALSYGVGRLVPEQMVARAFAGLGMVRASRLHAELRALPAEARVARLASRMPSAIGRKLLHYRHLTIAAALNIPGNSLVGGGGGIALAAGMSRLMSFPGFILTVALGTSPIPIVVLALAALR
jgi:hypothetical protein